MEELNKLVSKKDIIKDDPQDDMKSYIASLVNELRNDAEVYGLLKPLNLTMGEVKDNISKLIAFKNDYRYCKACPGLKACDKDKPHLSIKLEKDGKYVNLSYIPCEKIVEKIELDSHYLIADFPDEWKGSTLRTVDMSENRKKAIKAFASILKGESNRWLFIRGNHKTGKTFLLVTFANEFTSLGKGQVAVCNSINLFKSLADLSITNKNEFNRQMVVLSEVPLLILDDFGEEYKSEYIRDSIVLPLLSEREKNERLTFFTSDFTIHEIGTMYMVGKNSGVIRGKQLERLLNGMCEEEISFIGASIYRK